MNTIVLTFTYPADAEKAAIGASFLPKSWRKIWCVESAHVSQITPPEGVELLVRDFPRGNTLRGDGAVNAQAQIYRELGAECDCLVKLDSDTVLFRPEAFTAPCEFSDVDFTYIRRHHFESRLLANGCCYAMSRRAIERLATFPAEHPKNFKGHEDLIFSEFFTCQHKDLTLCQIDKTKVYWHTKPSMSSRHFAAHYGYITTAQMRALLVEHLKECRPLSSELKNLYEILH